MTKTPRSQRRTKVTKRALIAAATVSLVACSTGTPNAGPTSSSAPAAGQDSSCEVNPSSAPVPAAEPYGLVPEVGRITVALNGIPSGSITAGGGPTEVDVTVCNNSAVTYPEVGFVVVLEHCGCAPNPMLIPTGTVERFDPTTGSWAQIEHPTEGGGMDYLGTYSNVQELSKGKELTLRYRIALDGSMNAGEGGLSATAVTPEPLVQLGRADLPFTVVK